MIDHVLLEIADLERSTRFYDAVFFAVGVRRMRAARGAVAYGIDQPSLWLVDGVEEAVVNGHVSIAARGRAAVEAAHRAGLESGGRDDGAPAACPERGPRCYAAHLRDPDGLRVEVVAGGDNG